MGFAMIVRTGDIFGKKRIAWVYGSQVVNGISFAMLTISNFPELVDSVEQTPMYPSYKKDNVNLYISALFVQLSAIAQAFG